ncbi:MAG: universal stress protein [Leptolyngbyaceae cyanobacterium T60_A2020_046]|nr:universal stress protein [Leptolyngbyaceae cyanobacterium T60_A2020_046]
MFQTILVALDHSASADAILGALDQFKLGSHNRVVLTHVLALNRDSEDATHPRPTMDMDCDQAEHQLYQYQAKIPCSSRIEVVQGEPVEEILRLSKIHGADLIVLGSRGLTGLKRILEGSVSSQVLEDASCSVLVVKA